MAGIVVGSIDHKMGDGIVTSPQRNQELFKVLYDFLAVTMAGAGHCALVASNYGSGGTGTDFHDGANPFGENAWAVFNFPNSLPTPFHLLIQWADAASFGAAPGAPGLCNGSPSTDGVGCMVALREDGASPWGGTTGSPGSDTKGTPVWTAGGSTLHVLARSNAPGLPAGAFATNKENTHLIEDYSTNAINRLHMVGDADGIMLVVGTTNAGAYKGYYMGRYELRAGLSLPHPYVMIPTATSVPWVVGASNIYGNIAGSYGSQGGLLGRAGDGVRSFTLENSAPWFDSSYQPNGVPSPSELDAGKWALFQREVVSGLVGFLPEALVSAVYGVAFHETNAANTRAYMGTVAAAAIKFSIPWDGGAPPGTVGVRTGRQF